VTALTGALCAIGVSGLFGSIGLGGMVWIVLLAAGLATLAEGGRVAGAAPPGGAPAGSAPAGATPAGSAPTRSDRPAMTSGGPLLAGALAGALALGWAAADLVASAADRRGLSLMALSLQVTDERALMARRAAARSYERAAAWMPFEDAIFRRRADALRFLAAVDSEPALLMAEAARQARRAVALAPLRSLNHRYLGLILLSQARLGDASRIPEGEAAYARSLELAPHDALVLIELARAEIELGRPRQAIAPASRAAALYPAEAQPLAVLASAHLALGEAEPARAALARSLDADWRGDQEARRQAERTLESLGEARP
jgi:hypothetical protein